MAIKGKENLQRERERYLKGTYWQILGQGPWALHAQYLGERLKSAWRPLNEIAAIFGHNGCALYVGTGRIGDENLRVTKVHPFKFAEFEEDPRTKLMLPKL